MKIVDLYNYKEAFKIYKLISNKNHSNIFIYGSKNIDKGLFIKTILNEFFSVQMNLKKNDEISYEYNDYYYYFDIKSVKYDIKNTFINTLKPIVNTFNYYTNECNYIIFDNLEYINILIENQLKVIIEKSLSTTKFILITSEYDKHLEAIKSRCINIRIPELNIYDKEIFIKKYIDKNNIKIDNDLLTKIIKENDINLIKKKLTTNYKNPYDVFLDKIVFIMNNKLNKNIDDIKEIAYNFKNSVLDINVLCRKIIEYYLKTDILDKKKSKIINIISEFNYLMIKSYKDIIYIEYLFINLYNCINE